MTPKFNLGEQKTAGGYTAWVLQHTPEQTRPWIGAIRMEAQVFLFSWDKNGVGGWSAGCNLIPAEPEIVVSDAVYAAWGEETGTVPGLAAAIRQYLRENPPAPATKPAQRYDFAAMHFGAAEAQKARKILHDDDRLAELTSLFLWRDTPQGRDFWLKQCGNITDEGFAALREILAQWGQETPPEPSRATTR